MDFHSYEKEYFPVSYEVLKGLYLSGDKKIFAKKFDEEYISYQKTRIDVETKEEALENFQKEV